MSALTQREPPVPALTVLAAGGPQVRLLDARPRNLDDSELRAWARSFVACVGAPYATRSYRHPYALVAWHTDPVGIDIERIAPCDAAFTGSICTPSERLAPVSARDRDRYFTSLWSSKEAIAKALGDALVYDPRRLDAPLLWPGGRAGAWRTAQLPVADTHVAWVCWRAGDGRIEEPSRSGACQADEPELNGMRSRRSPASVTARRRGNMQSPPSRRRSPTSPTPFSAPAWSSARKRCSR